MSARSSVVNGVLTSPKERRSFKPEVESSILSGRISLLSPRCRSMPGAEPNAALLLDLPFRADPGVSDPFRKVVVASWCHLGSVAGGE